MKGITTWRNPQNAFFVVRLHYSADENKGPEWIEQARKGITSTREWDREYEISFESYAGKPVYAGFSRELHASEPLKWNPHKPMLRGWDFGFHHPAVVFAQISVEDRLLVFEAIMGNDILLHDFAEEVIHHGQEHYPAATWEDYCDPAGKQKSDKAKQTSIEILQSLGVSPGYAEDRRAQIDYGLQLIRYHLKPRESDEIPGILVDPGALLLIEAFQGGYHYPEAKEGKPESEKPEEDGYYEHPMDALRHIAIQVLKPVGEPFEPPEFQFTDPFQAMMHRKYEELIKGKKKRRVY